MIQMMINITVWCLLLAEISTTICDHSQLITLGLSSSICTGVICYGNSVNCAGAFRVRSTYNDMPLLYCLSSTRRLRARLQFEHMCRNMPGSSMYHVIQAISPHKSASYSKILGRPFLSPSDRPRVNTPHVMARRRGREHLSE
jgi:hypothetical protein